MKIQQVAPQARVNYTANPSRFAEYAQRVAEAKPYPDEALLLGDPHNQKMFGIIDKMLAVRDQITLSTKRKNIFTQPTYKQGLDGYTKNVSDVRRNPKSELSHSITVDTDMDRQLYTLEQQLKEQAKTVK